MTVFSDCELNVRPKLVVGSILETHALPTQQIRPAAVIGAGIAGLTGSGPRYLRGALRGRREKNKREDRAVALTRRCA